MSRMQDYPKPAGLMDEAAMTTLAGKMARIIKAPMIIYLRGDLGAGKTTFTRAFVHGLGYKGSVKSPTYGLLEIYPLQRLQIVHLDLYRIAVSGELEFLGIEDHYDSNTILMVEWPERGKHYLSGPDLTIHFEHSGEARCIEFEPHNASAQSLCLALTEHIQLPF